MRRLRSPNSTVLHMASDAAGVQRMARQVPDIELCRPFRTLSA